MDVLQQWLIAQRQEKGFTQQQLAESLAKSVDYVEQVEQGLYVLEITEYLHYCLALGADPCIGISLIDLALSKS